MFEPLIPAQVVAGLGDVPFSPQFGDVYHSAQGALAQAHHVFLRGNGLPERWRGRPRFTVCETGFGLGLNFLALWQAWRQDPSRCAALHMVSIEAHPFTVGQLAHWLHKLVPDDLRPLADALLAQWPALVPGLHRLEFDGAAVTLTLGFGRAETVVPRLQLAADAFFLDGFAPKRNPEMWSADLLAQLAQLGAPGATAATWATAGAMRRALKAAGFEVKKHRGFGPKRDMTMARLLTPGSIADRALAAIQSRGQAVVIGAGLAGAGMAEALARRGWDVVVLADASAPPGLGHLAAALTPLVDRDDSPRARLARAGVLRAGSRWQGLMHEGGSLEPMGAGPAPLAVARAGTVQVMKANRARRPEEALAWQASMAALQFAPDWMRVIDVDEASALAGQPVGRGGLYFPGGLLVRPAALCAGLLRHPSIRRVSATAGSLRRVAGGDWQVLDGTGATVLAQASLVVVACAAGAPGLLRNSGLAWPLGEGMQQVAGQISLLPARALAQGGPRCIVAGEGYVLPAVDGWCVAGSTYDHDASPLAPAPVSDAGHASNLGRVRALLPQALGGDPSGLAGWGGWRAVLPDRLPAIGALAGAPGVWLAAGYASRGLAWSALAGDLVGAALAGEPPVLEQDLALGVVPDRPGKPGGKSH